MPKHHGRDGAPLSHSQVITGVMAYQGTPHPDVYARDHLAVITSTCETCFTHFRAIPSLYLVLFKLFICYTSMKQA